MNKEKHKIINLYHPNAHYRKIGRLAVVGYAAIVAILAWFGVVYHLPHLELWFDVLAALVIGTIYSLIAWRAYFHAFVDKIIVTSQGLGVEGWHQAFSDWNTLSHFERQYAGKGRGKQDVEGIHTTKTVAQRKSRVWFDYDFTDNFIPLSHVYRIPYRMRWTSLRTEIDLDKFAQTPLGQDLLHYAPHLFEEEFIDAKSQS